MKAILFSLVIGLAVGNPCGSCQAHHPAGDRERYRMRMCACFYSRCKRLHHKDFWKPSRKGALHAYSACRCCDGGVAHWVRDPDGGISNDRRRRWSRSDLAVRKCRKMMNEVKKRKHFKFRDYVKHMVGKDHVCFVKPNRCYSSTRPDGWPGPIRCRTP